MCQDDIVDLLYSVCVEAREEIREAKHVNSQYQSISALGFKQVQSTCEVRCCGVPDAAQSIYLHMHLLLLAVIGWTFMSISRVQEGKKPAERARAI